MQAMGAALPELDGVEFTRNPPQKLGNGTSPAGTSASARGICFPARRARNARRLLRHEAPIWLSFGRLLKYFSVEGRQTLHGRGNHGDRACAGEQQADMRVVRQLLRLAAAEVGVEHQPAHRNV